MALITQLFLGFDPDKVFGGKASVDFSELVLVFGTIAISLGFLVIVGNWWSR
jgi:hypothetical protein